MNVAYLRCSSQSQSLDREYKELENCRIEKYFEEKISGKNMDRPQLQEMLNFVRSGDVLYVCELSRLGRSTKDLLSIVDILKCKNVGLVSLKEQINTTSPSGTLIFTIFSALSQFERETILEKQKIGIQCAKEKGVYKGKIPKKIDEEKFKAMCAEWRQGKRTATSIIKAFDISAPTFYSWVKIRNL